MDAAVNYTIDHSSETMLVTITCDIQKKFIFFSIVLYIKGSL